MLKLFIEYSFLENITIEDSRATEINIIGHPDEPEFHFCNKERFNDKPYCAKHCAVAYVLPEKEEELAAINHVA